MSHALSPPRLFRSSHRLTVIGIVLNLMIVAVVGLAIWDLHDDAISNNQRALKNLAVVLAEHTSRSMQAVDLIVKESREKMLAAGVQTPEGFKIAGGTEKLHEFLVHELKSLPQTSALALVGADGRLVNSSRYWPAADLDVSARDFYQHLRKADESGPFFGQPVRNHITGAWTIYLARRVNGPYGQFLGIVIGAIEVHYFADFYKAISLRKDGAVTLFRNDGMILVRSGGGEDLVGRALPLKSPWYTHLRESDQAFRAHGSFSNIARVAVLRPLSDYPLVVNVSVSEAVALAHWRRETTLIVIGTICAVVGFAGLFRLLAEQVRRLEEQAAELARTASALQESGALLKRSQDHLARAQQLAEIGSFEGYLNGGEIDWSDNFYQILGVRKESFVITQENVLALVHPEDRARYHELRRHWQEHTPVQGFEYRIIRPDGECRALVLESEVIRKGGDSAILLFGTVRDVTNAKATEERRRELEYHVQHTQRMESLGTLAGGIAHDLNNTMVPVVALSKLMSAKFPAGSRERMTLETIYDASMRARDLVKQILAFSKMEKPAKQLVELADFVRETLPMIRASVPSTIEIVLTTEENLPPLLADASQMHQVLINLVTNATQAIGENTGKITIALMLAESRTSPKPDDHPKGLALCLSVQDTGCGMDKTTAARIFEPFFTTKIVGEGTGLGLAVVHGIVGSHGGSIRVSSEPGQGTQFDIFLPSAIDFVQLPLNLALSA